jgi:hypothetical protein
MAQSTMARASSSLPSPNKAHMLTSPWNSFGQRFDNLTVWDGRRVFLSSTNVRSVPLPALSWCWRRSP